NDFSFARDQNDSARILPLLNLALNDRANAGEALGRESHFFGHCRWQIARRCNIYGAQQTKAADQPANDLHCLSPCTALERRPLNVGVVPRVGNGTFTIWQALIAACRTVRRESAQQAAQRSTSGRTVRSILMPLITVEEVPWRMTTPV